MRLHSGFLTIFSKMDVINKFHAFIFLLLAFLSLPIYAQDVCVTKSPCKCEFSNGTGIDLAESAKSTFYKAQYYFVRPNDTFEISIYYYHPCVDALPDWNVVKTPTNTCNISLAMCRYVQTLNQTTTKNNYVIDQGINEYLGSSNESSFSADGRTIIYNHLPSKNYVQLICADTEDEFQIKSVEDPNNLKMAFYSRNACLKQLEAPGRSIGSTLCIIFFSLVIFYLVLGVCTKKFLMGATGVEIIPNLGFWTDLPNLVKDGWSFALSGFKLPARGSGPALSPDPNSYDSI